MELGALLSTLSSDCSRFRLFFGIFGRGNVLLVQEGILLFRLIDVSCVTLLLMMACSWCSDSQIPGYERFVDLLYADTSCYAPYNGTDLHDYSTFLFKDKAVQIIEQHDFSSPMFLYLPFQAVHDPFTVCQLGCPTVTQPQSSAFVRHPHCVVFASLRTSRLSPTAFPSHICRKIFTVLLCR